MGISGDTTLDCHEEEKTGFDGRLHNIEFRGYFAIFEN